VREEDGMFRRILVAYDGSDGAKAALRLGVGLAKSLTAELHSVSVEEHLPHYAVSVGEVLDAKERVDEYFRILTKEARDQAALDGVELQTAIRQGHEVEMIVNYAREGAFDLLLAGYHGHSRIFERVIGSTAQSIMRLSPCSVLLAK
jgi:nucleotide-binding universal stress UspA family protein